MCRPTQYTAWVDALGAAEKTKSGSLALGKEIFQGSCATCHGLSGEGLVGPPLAGVATNIAGVEQTVRNGRNTMPAVGQGWSTAELHALIAYLGKKFGSTGGSSG